jgi:hypothetical protein
VQVYLIRICGYLLFAGFTTNFLQVGWGPAELRTPVDLMGKLPVRDVTITVKDESGSSDFCKSEYFTKNGVLYI